jgi:hypothetical protein
MYSVRSTRSYFRPSPVPVPVLVPVPVHSGPARLVPALRRETRRTRDLCRRSSVIVVRFPAGSSSLPSGSVGPSGRPAQLQHRRDAALRLALLALKGPQRRSRTAITTKTPSRLMATRSESDNGRVPSGTAKGQASMHPYTTPPWT